MQVVLPCMIHNGVSPDNLIEGAEVIKADYVIDALMGSKKTLQLN